MGSFSIKVICSKHRDPLSGRKVYINFGLLRGHDSQYTDKNGWAKFWITDYAEWFGDVYISNEKFASKRIKDGCTLSFTVDCKR